MTDQTTKACSWHEGTPMDWCADCRRASEPQTWAQAHKDATHQQPGGVFGCPFCLARQREQFARPLQARDLVDLDEAQRLYQGGYDGNE